MGGRSIGFFERKGKLKAVSTTKDMCKAEDITILLLFTDATFV